ncbi:MAG: radical SAM family heme chaperone HemW [Spirochaetia bacterium]|nr:radical SAM family heme chaperone HemW [Spirochaetia bacterium]
MTLQSFLHTYAVNQREISLYIHIPFCAQKCDYCAFYSESGCSNSQIDRYVFILHRELEIFLEKYTGDIDTVYIGGGDPGQLSPENLKKICKLLKNSRFVFSEFTMEINPETLNESIIDILPEMGITRISLGIQTFNEHIRSYIGRIGNLKNLIKYAPALRELQNTEGVVINTDFITSIPYQNKYDTRNDIRTIMDLAAPEHISIYDLSIEENTPLFKRINNSHNNHGLSAIDYIEDEALEISWQTMKELGYRHYEISNFCRDNKISKHNMNYWKMKNYTGFGSSAVSSIYAHQNIQRFSVSHDVENLLENQSFEGKREIFNKADMLKEYIMMHLRTSDGIVLDDFRQLFKTQSVNRIIRACKKWEKTDKILFTNGNVSLTENGMLIQNTILVDLFTAADGLEQ